jgi:hypothetical protein
MKRILAILIQGAPLAVLAVSPIFAAEFTEFGPVR